MMPLFSSAHAGFARRSTTLASPPVLQAGEGVAEGGEGTCTSILPATEIEESGGRVGRRKRSSRGREKMKKLSRDCSNLAGVTELEG